MAGFGGVGKPAGLRCRRCVGQQPGRPVGLSIEHQAVGVVAHPVQRGRSQQSVGREGFVPFGEVQIAGHDG